LSLTYYAKAIISFCRISLAYVFYCICYNSHLIIPTSKKK